MCYLWGIVEMADVGLIQRQVNKSDCWHIESDRHSVTSVTFDQWIESILTWKASSLV